MHSLIADFGTTALTYLAIALTFVVVKYGIERIKSERWRRVAGRAFDAVKSAFLEVGNGYVKALKATRVDGTWTDEAKAEAKNRAIAIAKTHIGKRGLKELAAIAGVDADGWLGNQLEAIVADEKRLGK